MILFLSGLLLNYIVCAIVVFVGLKWTRTKRVPGFVWVILLAGAVLPLLYDVATDQGISFSVGALAGVILKLLQQVNKELLDSSILDNRPSDDSSSG